MSEEDQARLLFDTKKRYADAKQQRDAVRVKLLEVADAYQTLAEHARRLTGRTPNGGRPPMSLDESLTKAVEGGLVQLLLDEFRLANDRAEEMKRRLHELGVDVVD